MRIVWDERKRQANLQKHGLDFASLTVGYFEDAIVRPARGSRMFAFGRLDGMAIVAVVFQPLGSEAIAVVSMRRASERERLIHDRYR